MSATNLSFDASPNTVWNLTKLSLTLGCTSKVTPPPRYREGGGVDGTSPWVFVMLQYLVESL